MIYLALQVGVWISAILFVLMPIFQVRKTLQTKTVKGQSVATWWSYAVALTLSALYLSHPLFIESPHTIPWPVLINQAISATLSFFQVYLFYKFKEK